jgi:hypothetical protein
MGKGIRKNKTALSNTKPKQADISAMQASFFYCDGRAQLHACLMGVRQTASESARREVGAESSAPGLKVVRSEKQSEREPCARNRHDGMRPSTGCGDGGSPKSAIAVPIERTVAAKPRKLLPGG